MRGFLARMIVCPSIVLMCAAVAISSAQAQTYQVLHTFTGDGDGRTPSAGLIFDGRGNLYGTAIYGGNIGGACQASGCGVVFQLRHTASGWVLNPLYTFTGGNDGMNPTSNVVFGPGGLLYGTTYYGGGTGCSGLGCGTVFSLAPPAHACSGAVCPWRETILHRFSEDEGQNPYASVIFDAAGNLYGTTTYGGAGGTVYELTPSVGGGWTEQVLHFFGNSPDGANPNAGLIFDAAGNLYGTATAGGTYNHGAVFELTPALGGGWTEQVLYSFFQGNDGYGPGAGLIADAAGNLYGTAPFSGFPGVQYTGVVFQVAPAGGSWTEQVLHQFQNDGADADFPIAGLIFDAAGNLYGTTYYGGAEYAGAVFELTPSQDGGWTEQVLYSFNHGPGGSEPDAGLVLDAAGNLYGTTYNGGAYNGGTVFELTPERRATGQSK